jgi:hypothetical protein
MIRADEFRKGGGQIKFSLAILNSTPLRTKSRMDAKRASQPSKGGGGISLAVSQVLVGWMLALSTVILLFWAVFKFWLLQ